MIDPLVVNAPPILHVAFIFRGSRCTASWINLQEVKYCCTFKVTSMLGISVTKTVITPCCHGVALVQVGKDLAMWLLTHSDVTVSNKNKMLGHCSVWSLLQRCVALSRDNLVILIQYVIPFRALRTSREAHVITEISQSWTAGDRREYNRLNWIPTLYRPCVDDRFRPVSCNSSGSYTILCIKCISFFYASLR